MDSLRIFPRRRPSARRDDHRFDHLSQVGLPRMTNAVEHDLIKEPAGFLGRVVAVLRRTVAGSVWCERVLEGKEPRPIFRWMGKAALLHLKEESPDMASALTFDAPSSVAPLPSRRTARTAAVVVAVTARSVAVEEERG